MFRRVVRVPRNDLVETSTSSCLVICRRAFGVTAMVLAVYENEIQASCFFHAIGQFIKNRGNAAYHLQLASTSYWSSVFSSVV